MYIIIVGGGKVGYYLAKSLMESNHEVLVIEKDPQRVNVLNTELGVSILEGDGSDVTFLEQAGASRANVVIAVTGDDEDNLVVCQIAKHKFNVARTIARLNNPKNRKVFRQLGIDVTVSSTELILSQIEQSIPAHLLVHLMTLRNAGIHVIEVEVPADSPAIGKPLRELGIPADCIFSLVVREGKESIIPSGDTMLQTGDHVLAVASEQGEAALRQIVFGEKVNQP
jgi:trk system potassium uptake protein TrkA